MCLSAIIKLISFEWKLVVYLWLETYPYQPSKAHFGWSSWNHIAIRYNPSSLRDQAASAEGPQGTSTDT